MKNIFAVLAIVGLVVFASCGGSKKQEGGETNTPATENTNAAAPADSTATTPAATEAPANR